MRCDIARDATDATHPATPAAILNDTQPSIRSQVLRGIALNRIPGYHFSGNFLDISFDHVDREQARLSLDAGPHCVAADGGISLGALTILADLTLATTIRAQLDRAARLATVTMSLQFSGAPMLGRLLSEGHFQGFFARGAERLGTSQVRVESDAGDGNRALVCFGTGAFIAIPPPKGMVLAPVPLRTRHSTPVELPDVRSLDAVERAILRAADRALVRAARRGDAFIDAFWGVHPRKLADGASCVTRNAPHIGNRVGHAQGGILIALAAATANAALAPSWAMSTITASFVSPGEGARLRVRSRIVHKGRLTAVIRTQITRPDKRVVLEVVSSHVHRV